ncbi:telomere-protecting terminal protein Tpg [Streptomyces aculeolatus]
METRARFGFTASPGSTDDPRMRRITEQLPPAITVQLLVRHAAGAGQAELRDLLGTGLGHAYFQDRGRRAAGLEVTVTDPASTNASSPPPSPTAASSPPPPGRWPASTPPTPSPTSSHAVRRPVPASPPPATP